MRALRFELRTSTLSGWRSNQLSYARLFRNLTSGLRFFRLLVFCQYTRLYTRDIANARNLR
jgi:hypothetical protein